jgi:hypothetical protein
VPVGKFLNGTEQAGALTFPLNHAAKVAEIDAKAAGGAPIAPPFGSEVAHGSGRAVVDCGWHAVESLVEGRGVVAGHGVENYH